MTYFAREGDLPMCRYLYHVREAVTTTVAEEHRTELDKPVVWYPLISAAYEYKFDTFKWLYQHGAKSEILEVRERESAISTCFHASEKFSLNEGAVGLAKWLVLEGVLEEGSDAKPAARTLHQLLHELQNENQMWELEDMPTIFLGWMKDILDPNVLFQTFLLGTLPDPQYSVGAMKKMLGKRIGTVGASMLVDEAVANGKSRDIWDCLLVDIGRTASANACLSSFDGVLEKIGDYVGVIKSKKLKRVADAEAIVQNVAIEDLMDVRKDRPR